MGEAGGDLGTHAPTVKPSETRFGHRRAHSGIVPQSRAGCPGCGNGGLIRPPRSARRRGPPARLLRIPFYVSFPYVPAEVCGSADAKPTEAGSMQVAKTPGSIFPPAFAVFVFVTLFAGSPADAREMAEIETDIRSQGQRIERQKADLAKTGGAIQQQKIQVSQAQADLDSSRRELNTAQEKLKEIQGFMLKFPDRVTSIDKEREALADARAAHERTSRRFQTLAGRLSVLEKREQGEIRYLNALEANQRGFRHELEQKRFEEFKAQLEKEQIVEARGEVSCGEMSISRCRKTSLEEAKRLAVEKASVNLVESLTVIENFRLTKDEIRAQVSGLVIRFDVLASGLIGETGYFHEIRAVVRSVVPDELRPRPRPRVTPTAVPRPQVQFNAETPAEAEPPGLAPLDRDGYRAVHGLTIYVPYFVALSTISYGLEGEDHSNETVTARGFGFGADWLFANRVSVQANLFSGSVTAVSGTGDEPIPASGDYSAYSLTAYYNWLFPNRWEVRVGGGLSTSSMTYTFQDPVLRGGSEGTWSEDRSGLVFAFGGGYVFPGGVTVQSFYEYSTDDGTESTRLDEYRRKGYTVTEGNTGKLALTVGFSFREPSF